MTELTAMTAVTSISLCVPSCPLWLRIFCFPIPHDHGDVGDHARFDLYLLVSQSDRALLTNRPQFASKLLNRNTLNMKILVCMKQVPQKDAPLKLNESGTWIRDDVSYEVNEPDAFALEEALRQKEKHTGEVVVITAGPARSQQVLREGLAKGADRAIHLEDNGFVGLDAFNMAKAFVAAIKDEKFDLIFTGLQSDDYGYAQTGVIMAELLGWPHATIIMEIQKSDSGIKVKRELESGFFQHVSMSLPAVLTIQSGINKLRYATLLGIKQAKNKPLRKVTMDEVKSALGDNLQKIEKLYVPQKTKKTEMLEGSPGEIAKKLVEKLRNDVRVI
jgi:electron transfer flavoprotein beta subunit